MKYLRLLISTVTMLVMSVSSAMALSFTDNFDDNSINSFWWTPYTAGGSAVSETNNRLEMVQGSSGSARLDFNFEIPGDFAMQVDYTLLNWPYNNQERVGLVGSFGAVERISDNGFSGEVYLTHFRGDGVHGITSTSHTTGKLKFTKTGSTMAGYYWNWNTANWIFIHSHPVGTIRNETIGLAIWPEWPVNQGVKVAFDNFRLDAPNFNPVPEPGTLFLLGSVVFGMTCFRRKKK